MGSMLVANPEDDVFFWPPTERTEAEGYEVGTRSTAWVFAFLGSRVQSFRTEPDRLIVYCFRVPAVDLWAVSRKVMTSLMTTHPGWSLPAGWEPGPAHAHLTSVVGVAIDDRIVRTTT